MTLLAASDLWTQILDVLYPPRCVGCQSLGTWFCEGCLGLVPRVEPPFCIRCGSGVENASSQLCPRCRTAPLQIERIHSAVIFEGVLREAVHKFKYDGVTALAEPLAILMSECWSRNRISAEVLVPVPLHRSRVRERGFNQAALLARELSTRIHLPVDELTLVRQRATASQVDLDIAERKENVRDAFRCTTSALAGKRVLVIDDVCTSGATLEACATALHDGGARRVQALTLARAGH